MIRVLLAVLGIATFGWSATDPRFVDHEGFFETIVALPWSIGVAFIVAAWCAGHRAYRLAGYAALFIVGHAASLQLIVATNKIGYQHYFSPDRILTDAPHVALLLVLLEAIVVVTMIVLRHRSNVKSVFARLPIPAALFVLAGMFITSATLSKNVGNYAIELVLATTIQLVHLGALGLCVAALPDALRGSLSKRWSAIVDRRSPSRFDPVAVVAAVWTTCIAAALCVVAYERHPHVPDEVVYLYHAKYFAEGMLTMPLPAAPDSFNVDLMFYVGDHWYCPVPIGWPSVLTLGVKLGVPWLVNPILAGACVGLVHGIVRGIYDIRTARLATIFAATSPWLIFLAMSFMTHTTTLFFALMAAYALVRIYGGGGMRWAALCGAMIGAVSLVRPLEGLAVAGVLGLWALTFGGKARFLRVVIMGVCTAAVASIALVYNQKMTGDPLKFPIMAYVDAVYEKGANDIGFGANRGLGWSGLDPFPGHGAIDVVVNSNLNLFQVSTELHGWAIGSLFFVFLLLVSRRMRRADWGMLGAIAVVVGLNNLYWFSGGPDFGARYWFLVFLPAIILSTRGVLIVSELVDRIGVQLMCAALCFTCVVSFIPWRAVDKYHHYRLMRGDVRTEVLDRDLGKSLILVRGKRHPDYASAMIYNPIDFDDPVPILAWDRGPEKRREVVQAYPDRPVYILDGPSITGAGYRLIAGPLVGIQAVEDTLSKRR